AAGAGDDMLSCVLLARTTQPVLLCPAMNTDMWSHPATRRNRKILEGYGYTFLEPGVGRLAEGVVGPGRLPEPADIVTAIRETLALRSDLAGLRVLVTAGPTREPVDPVRFLSNRSSGKMGYAVAAVAAERGAEVTLISGPVALPPPPGVEVVRVETAEQMADAVLSRSGNCDVVVQAAAVADFRPVQVADQKLKKRNGVSAIELKETMDIAAVVGKQKRPGQTLVGFAAETNELLANAQAKIVSKNLDLIVANDITEPGAGFDTDTNRVTFLRPGAESESRPLLSKTEVAHELWNRVLMLRHATIVAL
ncbi:MAG: bifunctional phosphopantothenoylcysteine decarboxylase/phosphopantothenate--cysteine ligase CoaBC, partial [Akkermansiaceae bacterium]|nr:bifunctional phosphopantothenoylcysteine decarboxylase/phosphopantothenate--cysteine ligase CoaBC [Armatimonadota bacterium]